MPLKIAIFGLGRIGKIHLDILSSCRQVKVKYLVEKDEFLNHAKTYLDTEGYDYFEKSNSENGFCLIGSSHSNLVYKSDIDAVYVCTPTDMHEDIVVEALKSGKAVFCEKPLAMSLKSTIKCYQLANLKNLPLLVAFNRRFDPQLVEARRKVSSNELGKLHQIRTVARDNPVPSYQYLSISGGIFHDCAVHDIDLCRFIASGNNKNNEVKSVYVTAHAFDEKIREMNDVDTVNIVLEFNNNLHCSIDLSRHGCYGYDQRCEIFAEKGLLSSENIRDSWLQQSNSRNEPDSGQFSYNHGTSLAPVQYTFKQRYAASYTEELYHFLDLMSQKSQNRVAHSDTILAGLLADCCEQAHHSKSRIDFDKFVRAETLKQLGKSYSVEDLKSGFSKLDLIE